MHYKKMIFCDFDGTITTRDTLEGFIQQFTDIDIRALGYEMGKKGYTVKRGITEMMALVPSARYEEGTEYFRNVKIREGFGEFLDVAARMEIPVVVISGGIREMTELVLAPYRDKIAALWAAKVDLSGEWVRFYSDYETETELVGKVGIIKGYDCDYAICIGDSYTDMEMGMFGNEVYARDRLAAALTQMGKPFSTFETFYDIIEKLKAGTGGSCDA